MSENHISISEVDTTKVQSFLDAVNKFISVAKTVEGFVPTKVGDEVVADLEKVSAVLNVLAKEPSVLDLANTVIALVNKGSAGKVGVGTPTVQQQWFIDLMKLLADLAKVGNPAPAINKMKAALEA